MYYCIYFKFNYGEECVDFKSKKERDECLDRIKETLKSEGWTKTISIGRLIINLHNVCCITVN